MTDNLPQIHLFGDKGVWLEPSGAIKAQLDEPTLARLDGVRAAYDNLKDAEAAEKAATAEVEDALRALSDAEAASKRLYKDTAHDLWIDNFGSPEARRALAQRRAGHGG